MDYVLDSCFNDYYLMYKKETVGWEHVINLANHNYYGYDIFEFYKKRENGVDDEWDEYNAISKQAYYTLNFNDFPYNSKQIYRLESECNFIGFFIDGVNVDKSYSKDNGYFSSIYNDKADYKREYNYVYHIPFNASIELDFHNDEIVDINANDLLIYAKYRWCMAFDFEYELYDQAKEVELKLNRQGIVDLTPEIERAEQYRDWIRYAKNLFEEDKNKYYQTEHWKRLSREARAFYQNKCRLCNKSSGELNVHHSNYENIGRETFNDLILLCKNCHKKYHGKDHK